MSLSLKRVIEEERKAKNEIYRIFRRTCENRLTCTQYLELRNKITYHQKLPRHSQATLQGYSSALFEHIQLEKVYFGFMHNGLITDYSDMTEEGKQLVREDKIQGQHYWKDTNNMKTSDIW